MPAIKADQQQTLTIKRRHTVAGQHPRETCEWETRDIQIKNLNTGSIVFEQRGVEVPKHWSENACNIVVQKYFNGKMGTSERERSVHQLINRVVSTFSAKAVELKYIAQEDQEAYEHELYYIVLHQHATWNSPVWFNIGIEGRDAQTHACVAGDERVMTDEGFLKIADVVNHREGKTVESLFGQVEIQAKKNNGKRKLVTLKLSNGQKIRLTEDHEIWTATHRDGAMGLTQVGKIRPNEYIEIGVFNKWTGDKPTNDSISEAFLVGWFIGDGSYSRGSSHIMEMCSVDDREREALDVAALDVFGRKFKKYDPSKDITDYKRCRLHGDDVVEFLQRHSLIDDNGKRLEVPESIFRSTELEVRAFLRGLFTTDGSIGLIKRTGRSNIRFVTVSEQLARDTQKLLISLGIYNRLQYSFDKRENRQPTWCVEIGVHSEIEKFSQLVGFASLAKTQKLDYAVNDGPDGKNVGKIRRLRITGIELSDAEAEDVYDLQTEPSEFSVSGIRVHNCHILKIGDNLESILQNGKDEAYIFSLGSGVGTNIGSLRSSKEHIKGGGRASGPISFMRAYDASAGVIQSGGKTRRAAIMRTCPDYHPDVYHGPDSPPGNDFVTIKKFNEEMAHVLSRNGYGGGMNNWAYRTVSMQNANLSVRISDAFMRALKEGKDWSTKFITERRGEICNTFPASSMMDEIAKGTWFCGDPGVQFDDTINRWHTCKADGRINSSNPCVTGDTLVATKYGYKRIDQMLEGEHEIVCGDGKIRRIGPAFKTGEKVVYELRTQSGYSVMVTPEHMIRTVDRGDVQAIDLLKDDKIELKGAGFGSVMIDGRLAELIGVVAGDGCISSDGSIQITLGDNERAMADYLASNITDLKKENSDDGRSGRVVTANKPQATWRMRTSMPEVVGAVAQYVVADQGSENKAFTTDFWSLDQNSQAQILSGLFTADGCVVDSGDKVQYVALDSTSLEMLKQTQLALLSFGIKSKLYRDRRATGSTSAMLPDGKGGTKEYSVRQMHSLRITRSSRVVFEQKIGFLQCSEKAEKLSALNARVDVYQDKFEDRVVSVEPVRSEPVYDLTEPVTNHFVANGIVVHNCSEYLFLDDTSCNLASMNLIKYWSPEKGFNVDGFMHDCRLMMIACDTSNSFAWFANGRLAKGVKDYRTIGLGYGNLGALVMAHGYAYDSHKARLLMSVVTSLLTSSAYLASTEMAAVLSPFPRFGANKESFVEVMEMHQQADSGLEVLEGYEHVKKMTAFVWQQVVDNVKKHGARNAQATVIAPTGTIMYMMDLSTSGPEPVLAHVSVKNLDGGGEMWLVNSTFKQALKALGFTDQQRVEIEDYVSRYGTVEQIKLPSDVTSVRDYFSKVQKDSKYVCPPVERWETRTCPHIKPTQISIFDTSFPAGLVGSRAIHHTGHIKALAAIQPFISGGMSKTINMPESATVQDIKEAYILAHELGVKCVAIYRSGSKGIQPLTTTLGTGKQKDQPGKVLRKKLSDDHEECIRHKFRVGPIDGYLHISTDPETKMPVEMFVTASQLGDTLNGMLAGIGRLASISLQCGVPLSEVVGAMKDIEFRPNGFTGRKFAPIAKSLLDYIARYFEYRWMDGDKQIADLDTARDKAEEDGHKVNRSVPYLSTSNCPSCSTPMKMVTSQCHSCPSCGYSEGGCAG